MTPSGDFGWQAGAILVACLILTLWGLAMIRRRRQVTSKFPLNPCSPDTPRTSAAVCFVDESGTDDEALEYGAVGGFITNWSLIPEFNAKWNEMLQRRNVVGGLHMRQLTPHGVLSHIVGKERAELLVEAVQLINEYRIFTMASVINNKDHKQAMPAELPVDTGSVYYTAFLMCVVTNRKMATQHGYSGTIDFIFDDGNNYKEQIRIAHAGIRINPEMSEYRLGDVHFCDDAVWPALQAADVLGWTSRRKRAGQSLMGALSPLNQLFDDAFVEQILEGHILDQLVAGYRRLINEARGPQLDA